MNTYELKIWDYTRTWSAPTAGKAKYEYFNYLDSSLDFGDFLKQVKCKLIHKFRVSDLFTDKEQFEYMKGQRDIEFAYQGMKVEVDGIPGTIIGNHGLNLLVCIDGNTWGDNCHPWWRVKYFDSNGNLVKEYDD